MEFECWGLISQLWWLGDRPWWIAGAEGWPDSHARLMNCEMRQTYKSCGQPIPGQLTPPPLPPPWSTGMLYMAVSPACIHVPLRLVAGVMWVALLATMEIYLPALGPGKVLVSFNDALWASIMLTFLLNVVLVVYLTSVLSVSHQHLHQRVNENSSSSFSFRWCMREL